MSSFPQVHEPHFLEGSRVICGGTVPPTLTRYVGAIGADPAKACVNIYAIDANPHEASQASALDQELLTFPEGEEGFTPETIMPYVRFALRINHHHSSDTGVIDITEPRVPLRLVEQ